MCVCVCAVSYIYIHTVKVHTFYYIDREEIHFLTNFINLQSSTIILSMKINNIHDENERPTQLVISFHNENQEKKQ